MNIVRIIAFRIALIIVPHQAKIKESEDADRNGRKENPTDGKTGNRSAPYQNEPGPPGISNDCLKSFHIGSFAASMSR